jgi:Fic family protein
MDWNQFDPEGAIRQRYLDIDETTEDINDKIELSGGDRTEFKNMYDISWIHHENGLEGVVLAYPEIRSAVDNKIVSDVSLLPTYRDIKAQKTCIDMMREKASARRSNITIKLLTTMHGLLLNDPEKSGTYRKDIPIHRTYFHEIAEPTLIESKLSATLDYVNAKKDRDLHGVEFAANVHHRFMRVFPFSKHSGIIGRLLMNYVLERHGYFPAVIHATDRQRYDEALRGEESGFREFLCETLENGLDNTMKFFKHQEQVAARGA